MVFGLHRAAAVAASSYICLVSSTSFTVAIRPSSLLLFATTRTYSRMSPALRSTANAPRTIQFGPDAIPTDPDHTMLIGKRSDLEAIDLKGDSRLGLSAIIEDDTAAIAQAVLQSVPANKDKPSSASTFLTPTHRLHWGVLPDTVSRHNHPFSVSGIPSLVSSAIGSSTAARILFCGIPPDTHDAVAAATAKAFPLFSRKTKSAKKDGDVEDTAKPHTVHVGFLNDDIDTAKSPAAAANQHMALAAAVRQAGRLMDMPPAELTTTAFAEECRTFAATHKDTVTLREIVGSDLRDNGYGGLYGVGQGAVEPPRLVILEYTPSSGSSEISETIALVGKGIVFDTGGLSLKSTAGMCGMKHDMGGAAGLFGAFCAAVERGLVHNKKIVLHLCLAENAIGPNSFRNDDILTMYSGKTVEINNSDAEGRLVLGDGVAHATRHIESLDLVIDMATLTGAQLVATGKTHAGILANSDELEQRAMKAGMASGDLVFPLLYCPELLMKEFDSKVADMKNSVKDRGNAQTSCAGHFIESHLAEDYKKGWLHIDMAGPGSSNERGTGYGVALVLALLEE